MWVRKEEDGRQTLLYGYYEKPVTSNLVIMEKSALPMKTKMTVLSQEVIRVMRNTAEKVDTEEKAEMLTGVMTKLARSGYSEGQRKKVLYAGMEGYSRMKWRQRIQGRRVNRPRGYGASERAAKKLLGKTNWFKSKRSAQQLEDEICGSEGGEKSRCCDRVPSDRVPQRQSALATECPGDRVP